MLRLKSVLISGCVRLGNPDLDFQNLNPDFPIERTLNVVPNSNLPGSRFFGYCICIIMLHSHLNDMEIPETKRFIPKGFELGTTFS